MTDTSATFVAPIEHVRPAVTAPLIRVFVRVQHLGTYFGLVIVAFGAALLGVAWGKTAGLRDVALQLPYLVSAGFTGVALGIVGLTVVAASAAVADFKARTAQVEELQELLAELRRTLEEDVA